MAGSAARTGPRYGMKVSTPTISPSASACGTSSQSNPTSVSAATAAHRAEAPAQPPAERVRDGSEHLGDARTALVRHRVQQPLGVQIRLGRQENPECERSADAATAPIVVVKMPPSEPNTPGAMSDQTMVLPFAAPFWTTSRNGAFGS